MAENGKTAELQRITGDLERYVETHCARAAGEASDFAGIRFRPRWLSVNCRRRPSSGSFNSWFSATR